MTKKEYLKSIGYERYGVNNIYVKYRKFGKENNEYYCALYIKLDPQNTYSIQRNSNLEFNSQKDIDELQIAFNNLRRDCEETQKYTD